MAGFAAGADDDRRASRPAELALVEACDDKSPRAEALAAMAVTDLLLPVAPERGPSTEEGHLASARRLTELLEAVGRAHPG